MFIGNWTLEKDLVCKLQIDLCFLILSNKCVSACTTKSDLSLKSWLFSKMKCIYSKGKPDRGWGRSSPFLKDVCWQMNVYCLFIAYIIVQQPDVAESWLILQWQQKRCCTSWTQVCYPSNKEKEDEGPSVLFPCK